MWISLNVSFWKMMTSLLTFLTSLQLFFRLLRSAVLLLYYVSSDFPIHISVRDNLFVERKYCNSNANLIQNPLEKIPIRFSGIK